jgi:protocatechuate 3,4-dioxygenase beta subunit
MEEQLALTRRRFIELGLALPTALLLPACSGVDDSASATETATREGTTTTLEPTPACDDGDEPTVEQTEGPFFTPDSPERASLLEPGIEGVRFVLAGSVLATDCSPVAGALLDFWHADAQGEYDNEGYRLRGHQFADSRGRYRLETIVPGLYTGRTRHIHVKVQAPDQPVLTTQLYFPGEPGNDGDSIFDPTLLIELRRGDTEAASFDFVLEL